MMSSFLLSMGSFLQCPHGVVTATGLKFAMDIQGIELCNSSARIKLTPAIVSINDEALEVI